MADLDLSTARRRSPGVGSDHRHYKWWALSCTSLGMLMATINSGTLIIALPTLETSLHTSLLELVWVILAYMIASTVLVLTAGRLSDLFGRKHAFAAGFAVFALASLGAGFAGSGTELILWRVLQGIGAAFLFANAAAIVTDAFPVTQLGVAMGTNVMVAAVGLVLGPVLGGALVSISWQWVFWFNVPFGVIGAAWALAVLVDTSRRDSVRGLDPLGTVTFLVGFTGLVLAISRGGLTGWGDPIVILGFAAATVLLPLFIYIESSQRAPMLDLSLFRDRLFSAAAGASFLNGLSRFALMLIFSPFAGVIADRRGSRTLASLGMVVSALGLAAMTTLAVNTPFWQSGLWLFIVGCGSGLFNSPNTAAMMGAVAANRRGIAAGARLLVQNAGAVISIAFVMAAVLFKIFSGLAQGLTAGQLAPFINNMHLALWILTVVSLAGAAVSMMRPSHARQLELRAASAAPQVNAVSYTHLRAHETGR